jgi:hypothetical protein
MTQPEIPPLGVPLSSDTEWRPDRPQPRIAWRKLAMLDAAELLADLHVPPGNRLEKLTGDRARAVQHPDKPAVADLLLLVGCWTGGRADR